MKVIFELDTERDDSETVERMTAAIYPRVDNAANALFRIAQMLRGLDKYGTAEGIKLQRASDGESIPEEITKLIEQIHAQFWVICNSYDVDPFEE